MGIYKIAVSINELIDANRRIINNKGISLLRKARMSHFMPKLPSSEAKKLDAQPAFTMNSKFISWNPKGLSILNDFKKLSPQQEKALSAVTLNHELNEVKNVTRINERPKTLLGLRFGHMSVADILGNEHNVITSLPKKEKRLVKPLVNVRKNFGEEEALKYLSPKNIAGKTLFEKGFGSGQKVSRKARDIMYAKELGLNVNDFASKTPGQRKKILKNIVKDIRNSDDLYRYNAKQKGGDIVSYENAPHLYLKHYSKDNSKANYKKLLKTMKQFS